ncbi:MAG TPA: antibiotic resistance protein VanZ [Nitrospirales bacterium]|nr:antibiotic resistance protein VanZ [Nitrospirales bacterium]
MHQWFSVFYLRRSVIGAANRWETVLAWLVFLGYATVIFYLSSQSEPPRLPFPVFPGLDKIVHACEFGLFGLVVFWAVGCSFQTLSVRSKGIVSVVISVLYGVSDEIHQTFVPMRLGDPFDVLADAAGAVGVLIAFRIIHGSRCDGPFQVR